PIVFQHRQVHDADSDPCAQLRQRHAALDEQLVQAAVDAGELVVRVRGTHTSPSVSRCRRAPTTNTVPITESANAARMKVNGSIDITAVSVGPSVSCAIAAFASMLSK